ncbi:MAG: DUF423 domain-containing protein, partial [Burkholderiales bacterium]|nr:DUF423 domain-containing protein [Burkholderiales bacterium]
MTLGAYGAHGLQGRFDADSAAVWHTAVEYHLFHALGLLIVGLIAQRGRATRLIELSGWLMVC